MSKGAKAPTTYVPTGSPQVDQNYQSLLGNATPYAEALPGQVIPGLQTAATNVANNPYYNDAQYGAQYANAAAQQQVVPGQLQANSDLNALGSAATNATGAATAGAAYAAPNYAAEAANGQYGLGIGQQALAAGQQTYNDAQSLIPGATGGSQIAPQVLQALTALAPGVTMDGLMKAQQQYSQAQAAIPGLTGGMGAAQQVLNTGFDPQNALYDRQQQQTSDKANAINAMYGLGTSAAGAGLANDASRNFNIDWQNNQLARQVQALGAYGAEQGVNTNDLATLMNTGTNNYNTLTNGAVNNLTNLTNSGVNDYNSLNAGTAGNFAALANAGTNAMAAGTTAANQSIDNNRQALTQAAQNYQTLMGGAVDNYGNLVNAANQAYSGAGTQGTNATQLIAAAGQAPSQTYLQQQQAQIAALQALSQTGAQSLAPTASLAGADAQYLNTGQNATSVNQNATNINNQQANGQLAGIGNLVGTVAAVALAPATGGLSLFGLGATAAGGH